MFSYFGPKENITFVVLLKGWAKLTDCESRTLEEGGELGFEVSIGFPLCGNLSLHYRCAKPPEISFGGKKILIFLKSQTELLLSRSDVLASESLSFEASLF